MKLTELCLATRDITAQRSFYAQTLGLPLLEDTAEAITMRVGATRLTFTLSSWEDSTYHLAFTVPRNKLTAAKEWLLARVSLLTADDRDEFDSVSWDARMVYFRDPAGTILECIARRTLPNDTPGPFGPHDLLCVSEVGLPVDDVANRVRLLQDVLGIAPYKEQSATFAPLGDEHGLLIVVKEGRPWFPTATRSVAAPASLSIQGAHHRHHDLLPLPYTITVRVDDDKKEEAPCDAGGRAGKI